MLVINNCDVLGVQVSKSQKCSIAKCEFHLKCVYLISYSHYGPGFNSLLFLCKKPLKMMISTGFKLPISSLSPHPSANNS